MDSSSGQSPAIVETASRQDSGHMTEPIGGRRHASGRVRLPARQRRSQLPDPGAFLLPCRARPEKGFPERLRSRRIAHDRLIRLASGSGFDHGGQAGEDLVEPLRRGEGPPVEVGVQCTSAHLAMAGYRFGGRPATHTPEGTQLVGEVGLFRRAARNRRSRQARPLRHSPFGHTSTLTPPAPFRRSTIRPRVDHQIQRLHTRQAGTAQRRVDRSPRRAARDHRIDRSVRPLPQFTKGSRELSQGPITPHRERPGHISTVK